MAGDGWIAREGTLEVDAGVAEEFPGLRLPYSVIDGVRLRRSRPTILNARLAEVAERLDGPMITALRASREGLAYRAFFRQVGLDPDRTRPPVEGLVAERLMRGGFVERSLWQDALVVGAVSTGVALQAFDARRLRELPRLAVTPEGRLVLRVGRADVADLLGEVPRRHRPGEGTRTVLIVATVVPGIPDVSARAAIEEMVGLLAAASAR